MNTHDTPLSEIRRILENDRHGASVRMACARGDHRWVHPYGVKGMPRYCDRCGTPMTLFYERQKEAKP